MIQDIYPHKLHNEYIPDLIASNEDFLLIVKGNDVLVKADDSQLSIPKLKDFIEKNPDFNYSAESENNDSKIVFAFKIDEEKFYLLRQGNLDYPKDYEFRNVRQLRDNVNYPKKYMLALFTAKHLNDWYGDNVFCPRCGRKMHHSDKERAMCCDECKFTSYPRIMPAVIVGVKNGDKILLTKYRRGFAQNALIAGFIEIGETAEEAVAREVMEEAGIKVKNITYYKSQPWGIANDLLLGYYCELDGDSTIVMDENELKEAVWTSREDVILQSSDLSLTNEMMKKFKDGEV